MRGIVYVYDIVNVNIVYIHIYKGRLELLSMSMMSIYQSIRACESLVYVNDMQVIDIDKHFQLSIKVY